MSKQQTAVEWFKSEIDSMQNIYMDLAKKNKSLKKEVDGILTATTILRMKCKQAKEMEKIQMINTWITSEQWSDGKFTNAIKAFKEYYKETYESQRLPNRDQ